MACCEAHRCILVGEATVDAAGNVDQRGVEEVDNLSLFEVVGGAVKGERGQAVTFLVCLNEVGTDGHGEFILTIGVGHHHALLGLHQGAIDLELYAVSRDVGVEISDLSFHRER